MILSLEVSTFPNICYLLNRCWKIERYKRKKADTQLSKVQSCPTLCHPVDCSLPVSSVHGIFQAIVLEWVAISFSRGSSQPRDWTWVSRIVADTLPSAPPGKSLTEWQCLPSQDWEPSRASLKFFFNIMAVGLEKEMATHSSILAWRISQTEEPGWI